jgi:hypothetical protein
MFEAEGGQHYTYAFVASGSDGVSWRGQAVGNHVWKQRLLETAWSMGSWNVSAINTRLLLHNAVAPTKADRFVEAALHGGPVIANDTWQVRVTIKT